MKGSTIFGWLMAAFGAFAAVMVLVTLGEQTAEQAAIRFISCLVLAAAGVVVARRTSSGVPAIELLQAERHILAVARNHGGRVTAVEVAAETPVPLAQATEMLEAWSRRGTCRMSVAEAGILVFEFPELEPEEQDAARGPRRSLRASP